MSNVFEILKRMGGVVEENGVTYVTYPAPPAGDDSQKIATTAWVKDITDALEASVSGGMYPVIRKPSVSGANVYIPSGGTWWAVRENYLNGQYSGGSIFYRASDSDSAKDAANITTCIKIA